MVGVFDAIHWLARMRVAVVAFVAGCVVGSLGMSPGTHAEDRGAKLGHELGRVALGGIAQSIEWSPDQTRLVVVVESLQSAYRRVILIDVAKTSIEWSVDGQDTRGSKAAFLDGGRSIVTRAIAPIDLHGLNWNLALSILDAGSGRLMRHVATQLAIGKGNQRARDFSLSEDRRTIAVLAGTPDVLGFDTQTWTQVWHVRANSDPKDYGSAGKRVALDSRPNRVIVARSDLREGAVQVWDLSIKSQRQGFVPYKSGLSRMVVDPTTGILFTGGDGLLRRSLSNDPSAAGWFEDDPATLVKARDPSAGLFVRAYAGAGQEVAGLAVSFNGRYLLAAKSRDISPPPRHKDAHVTAWDAATGRQIASANYGQGSPGTVAFSPDARMAAIADGHTLQIIALDPRLLP